SLAQRAAINGHTNTGFCNAWITSFLNAGNPTVGSNCGFTGVNAGATNAIVYNPTLRPQGIRCDAADHAVAMFGTFVATDNITKAQQPGDNEGVQYGLKALQNGVISAEEFVRLNEGVGSYNADLVWSGLTPGLPAKRQIAPKSILDTVYSAGIVADGRQLAKIPIIDLRGNQAANGDIHMNWRAWETRDRLD